MRVQIADGCYYYPETHVVRYCLPVVHSTNGAPAVATILKLIINPSQYEISVS